MRTTKNSKKELKTIFPSVAELSAMVEAKKNEAPAVSDTVTAKASATDTVTADTPEAPKAEKPKTETKVKTVTVDTPKPDADKGLDFVAPAVIKTLTLDELTDKAERVYLLKQKYAEIRTKKQQLERFTIKKDSDTATLTLRDIKGETITTHNPRAIGNLLADWAKDLTERLVKVEQELRAELNAL